MEQANQEAILKWTIVRQQLAALREKEGLDRVQDRTFYMIDLLTGSLQNFKDDSVRDMISMKSHLTSNKQQKLGPKFLSFIY